MFGEAFPKPEEESPRPDLREVTDEPEQLGEIEVGQIVVIRSGNTIEGGWKVARIVGDEVYLEKKYSGALSGTSRDDVKVNKADLVRWQADLPHIKE